MLRGLTDTAGGRLLVGPRSLDDAGVVVLEDAPGPSPSPSGGPSAGASTGGRLALVQTVDFFPPVVDDPTLYGAIAAANALSDVYAMGGRPFSALAVAGFPAGFSAEWRDAILRGGWEKIREAGAVVAGGHTVESPVQFGFAVTGLVDPERVTTNAGARAGDVLYLTKPIGMGCMTTAAKLRKIRWEEIEPAARQMATLNAAAAEAMAETEVHACTDVTGYGLLGHAMNVARASEVTLRIAARDVPLFPGALELARRGLFSGGEERGRETLSSEVEIGAGLERPLVGLLFDAETSGGLLIAVPSTSCDVLEEALRGRGVPVHRVGEVLRSAAARIELV